MVYILAHIRTCAAIERLRVQYTTPRADTLAVLLSNNVRHAINWYAKGQALTSSLSTLQLEHGDALTTSQRILRLWHE